MTVTFFSKEITKETICPCLFSFGLFADNAKTKVQHIYNGSLDTERAKDMIECDQDGRLMVHTTKQYPTEDATCFHVFGRVMSGTIHANQQVRLLGENYSMFDEEDSRTLTTGISKMIIYLHLYG